MLGRVLYDTGQIGLSSLTSASLNMQEVTLRSKVLHKTLYSVPVHCQSTGMLYSQYAHYIIVS